MPNDDSSRGQNALVCLIFLLLGIAITWVAVDNLRHEIRIFASRDQVKARGKATVGIVTSCETQHRKTDGAFPCFYTVYIHTVQYDGFTTTWNRPNPVALGSRLPVLYMADNPENMIVGEMSQRVEDMRRREVDIFALGFGLIVYLALGFLGLVFLGLPLLFVYKGRGKTSELSPNREKKGVLGECESNEVPENLQQV